MVVGKRDGYLQLERVGLTKSNSFFLFGFLSCRIRYNLPFMEKSYPSGNKIHFRYFLHLVFPITKNVLFYSGISTKMTLLRH